MGLDSKQINDLSIGIKLAKELKASELCYRKFSTIQGYIYNDKGHAIKPDKFLKANKINDILFEVRIYELSIEYYTNGWDVTEDDLVNEIYIDDIKGIEELELILNKYITDYSDLKPEWYSDNLF